MAKYQFEFGKMWDERVPRNYIRWVVFRDRSSKTREEIAEYLTTRFRAVLRPYGPDVLKQSVQYAMECLDHSGEVSDEARP